eukprot:1785152-Rhodomonas_salina.1
MVGPSCNLNGSSPHRWSISGLASFSGLLGPAVPAHPLPLTAPPSLLARAALHARATASRIRACGCYPLNLIQPSSWPCRPYPCSSSSTAAA